MKTSLANAPLAQAFPASELPIKKSLKNVTRTIAIGGGKGGVGKTIFAVYLAQELSRHGKKVLLVDSDFTSPCLHHFFQIQSKKDPLLDFEKSDKLELENSIAETEFYGIDVLFRYPRSLRVSESNLLIAAKLLRQVVRMDYDFVIFDLGSGLNETDIYFFLNASERIVIGTPEPAVLSENFRFLKICVLKKLEYILQKEADKLELIKTAYFENSDKLSDIIRTLINSAEANGAIKKELKKFQPYFILNLASSDEDIQTVKAVDLAMKELYGFGIEFVGSVPFMADFRLFMRKRDWQSIFKVFADRFSKLYKLIAEHGANGELDSSRYSGKLALKKLGDFVEPDTVICSKKCGLWSNCNYQLGGYPCRIKYIGYVHQN